VERGLRADRSDAMMLATGGQCFAWFAHDLAKGIRYVDEALALNPNLSHAFMQSGILCVLSGLTAIGIEHLERARPLSPHDSRNYATFAITALAYQLEGDMKTARDWALRSAQHNPNYAVGWLRVASVTALLGQQSEARAAVGRVLAISPTFSVCQLKRSFPIGAPEMFESYWKGLRLAGLPE
jgi:adenylate cyclase